MVEIPTIVIPPVETIETISIPLPTADVPSYIPMVVPPSNLQAEDGIRDVERSRGLGDVYKRQRLYLLLFLRNFFL